MFAANKTGVTSTPAVTTDPYFNYTTLLLNDTGTNGAQNNTFVDSSTNNFSITRTGNTTQGSFNPYEPTGYWGGYFDGTGDYLSTPSTATLNLGTGDFTYELWVYHNVSGTLQQYADQSTFGFSLSKTTSNTLQLAQANIGVLLTSTGTISANQWVHVACTRSGTTVYMFANGVLIGSGTVSTNFNPSSTFYIGQQTGGAFGNMNGYISNVRLVKGTAVYTAAFTPPTTPLTAISGTVLLCLQDNRFKDNSSNNFTLTRSGDVAVTGFNPFAPTASYTTSAYGGSAYFDGTGDYLNLTSTSALQLSNSTAFTIECWIYADASVIKSLGGFILRAYNFSSPYQGYGLGFGADGTNSQIQFWDGTAWTSFGTVSANTWTHIAISYEGSGSTRRFFINGVQQGSAGTVPSTINWTGTTFNIGTRNADFYYMGYISNFRIVKGTAVYTAAFTPPTAPVTAITNTSLLLNATNAGIYDATAINDMETVGNAQVSTTQAKWGSSSMYFDNAGDYLAFPAKNELTLGTGAYTVECWIYNLELVNLNTLFTWWNSGTDRRIVRIGSTNINYASQSTLFIAVAHGMVINQWYHIALTYDGTTTRIFVGGVLKGTYTGTQMFTAPAPFYIGAGGSTLTADYFYGYIEDFRITKGVARYTANFTPPTAPFPTR